MDKAKVVLENIANRRTIKPEQCSGGIIPKEDVEKIIACANWAPTHGYTEPWRLIVFEGEGKNRFSTEHAEMYKQNTPAEQYKQVKYDKIIERGALSSHIVAVVMKRGENPRIPIWEEMCATAAATQNMQLAASALGYGAYWASGGMMTHEKMHEYFHLGQEDQLIAFMYLGVPTTEIAPGRRITGIEEKLIWIAE